MHDFCNDASRCSLAEKRLLLLLNFDFFVSLTAAISND